MEQFIAWSTFIGVIIIPCLGWIINQIVTKKIDDLDVAIQKLNERLDTKQLDRENDKKNLYASINGQRTAFETTLREYVRKDLYDQAIELHRINNDEKFKSLLSIVTTQYSNLESKINENNINMNEKISGLKTLINEKFHN